jgi:hypothetical protein
MASAARPITRVSLSAAEAKLRVERRNRAKKKTIFFIELSPIRIPPYVKLHPQPISSKWLGVPYFGETMKFVMVDGNFAKAGMCLQRE